MSLTLGATACGNLDSCEAAQACVYPWSRSDPECPSLSCGAGWTDVPLLAHHPAASRVARDTKRDPSRRAKPGSMATILRTRCARLQHSPTL
jgi:hypothetical protein